MKIPHRPDRTQVGVTDLTLSDSSWGCPAKAAKRRLGVRVLNSSSVSSVRVPRRSTHSSATRLARPAVYSGPSCVQATAIALCPMYSHAW